MTWSGKLQVPMHLLPNDQNPMMQVEYLTSENLYKSVFKLTGKQQYNATLINYTDYPYLNDPPKNEIKTPQLFVSKKRSMKNIMKDRFKKLKNSTNKKIVDDQSTKPIN